MEATALSLSPRQPGEIGEAGLVGEHPEMADLGQEACGEHGLAAGTDSARRAIRRPSNFET